MPLIDGINYTDDEYQEKYGSPGPTRPDFEARGYRDNYPNAVQDTPGHNYVTTPGYYVGGEDGSSGSRTPAPTGKYLTPDEANERGVAWTARAGEPQDLRDPFHYQSPDEARALGRNWATQPAIASGNARHAGIAPNTPMSVLLALQGGAHIDQFAPQAGTWGNGQTGFQNGSPLFSDPASRLLEDYAMDRFQQRQNPDPNSGTALFESYARQLIDTLKQPVNSPQDEAILKGKAVDGIERERAATKQRWIEEISRRGLSPRDGPYLDGLMRIDEYFNQARNTFETEFAKDAIQQTRQQRFQVLDTAGQLAGSEEGRLREAGTYAAIPKQIQDNSFQQGLQLVGAGGSPQSVLNSLMQLQQMNQNQSAYDSQRKAALSSGLLQYLGYYFGG
jgi:hypothetical protein